MVGKRRTRARRLAKAQGNNTLIHCPDCQKVFVTEPSRLAHIRDAHGPNAKLSKKAQKAKGRAAMPAHVKNGRQVHTFGSAASEPLPALMEIDFITPCPEVRCLTCGLPGAIPLTCLCPNCDPLVILLKEDAETRSSKVQVWGYEPWDDTPHTTIITPNQPNSLIRVKGDTAHDNVRLLPRPTATVAEPVSNTQRIRNAIGHFVSGAAPTDPNAIPHFLRREPELNLEAHDRLLK